MIVLWIMEVIFSCYWRTTKQTGFCLRPTKKTKKYAVTKKSLIFAAENENE